MYVRAYVYVYICTHVSVCACAYMHEYVYMCARVYAWVCMRVCACVTFYLTSPSAGNWHGLSHLEACLWHSSPRRQSGGRGIFTNEKERCFLWVRQETYMGRGEDWVCPRESSQPQSPRSAHLLPVAGPPPIGLNWNRVLGVTAHQEMAPPTEPPPRTDAPFLHDSAPPCAPSPQHQPPSACEPPAAQAAASRSPAGAWPFSWPALPFLLFLSSICFSRVKKKIN